ncbi:MAG: Spi family protease inhibitor [Bacteroidales bacterium]|nr:Spi family protease inhibitor [Bacteroidales bacterium]
MKKILMTAILCCAMTTTMMAEPVSPETARQAAAKFLNKKGVALKSEAMRAKNRAMGHSDSGEQTEASPYYVFNATASQGFVVVSGDDCVGGNLVLGYTSQGSFDAEASWWRQAARQTSSTASPYRMLASSCSC